MNNQHLYSTYHVPGIVLTQSPLLKRPRGGFYFISPILQVRTLRHGLSRGLDVGRLL